MYLIELGRQSLLCVAECASLLQWQSSPSRLEVLDPHILLVEVEGELSKEFFDQLGGAIRVARCVGTISEFSSESLLPLIEPLLETRRVDATGEKVVFGLSIFAGEKRRLRSVRQAMADVLTAVKDRLRERGLSSRYIEPHEEKTVLSSAQVGESGILDKGFELVVARRAPAWTVGVTCWIQDYSSQSSRDFKRPCADPRSGMLPPKLARMMVNLARGPQTKTLLDPFCGSGGILMEAGLLGLSPTGLDRDLESVKAARENHQWLCDLRGGSLPAATFCQGDATEMHRYFDPLSFDCVATEPYLGPPLAEEPSPRRVKQILGELSVLYREVLAEIRIVTRPGGKVIFVAPRFRDFQGGERSVALGSTIRVAGYRPVDPLSAIRHPERLGVSAEELRLAQSGVLSYSRPDQRVAREIHVLRT